MAETPDLVRNAFAVNGDRGEAPLQSSPDGMVNFNDGYTTAYEMALDKGNPLARPVARQTQNYLFYQMSLTTKAWQQMTFAPFYAGMPNGYEIGAHVYAEDSTGSRAIFRCTMPNNLNEPKSLTGWEVVPLPSEMWQNIPMPSGGGIGRSRLISSPVDIRTLPRGTYTIQTDQLAASCQNMPARPGQPPIAGMYEVMVTPSSIAGDPSVVEARYHDRLGNTFTTGAVEGNWSTWSQNLTLSSYQQGVHTFGVMSGSATAAVVTTLPAFTPVNGTIISFAATASIANDASLAVNGTSARPIFGQNGQRIRLGTIPNGSNVSVQLNTTKNAWVVIGCTASPQIEPATDDSQAVQLGQLNQILIDYRNVEWENVLNKPRLAIWGDPSYFTEEIRTRSLAILAPNDDPEASEPNAKAWRFVTSAGNGATLSIINRGSVFASLIPIPAVTGSSIRNALLLGQELQAFNGTKLAMGGNVSLVQIMTRNGSTALWDMKVQDTGTLTLERVGLTGSQITINSNGAVSLAKRPTFNGATPYDSRNFQTAGMIVSFGAQHNQVGWIYCDGRELQIADYPALFAVIGRTYGGTATTFRVPDLRGYHPRGWSDTSGRDPFRALGSVQSQQVGGHTHQGSASTVGNHTHNVTGNTSIVADHTHGAALSINNNGAHTHAATTSIAAGGVHYHDGVTSVSGEHVHNVKEGHFIGVVQPGGEVLASGDDYTTNVAYYSTTTSAGSHSHTTQTYNAGNHSHGATTSVGDAGLHSHTGTVGIQPAGSHDHVIQAVASQAGEHTHSVTISNNNAGAENRVDNIALPYYISTGELGTV